MEEYAKSLHSITEIRKVVDRKESLNKEEMKLYRKITGKIAWLTNSNLSCYTREVEKVMRFLHQVRLPIWP